MIQEDGRAGAGIDAAARAISAYNRGETQGAGRASEAVTV